MYVLEFGAMRRAEHPLNLRTSPGRGGKNLAQGKLRLSAAPPWVSDIFGDQSPGRGERMRRSCAKALIAGEVTAGGTDGMKD